MRALDLHTVCEEANCPNIGECWHHGTATFMILGGICTRSCGYCNVVHGTPHAADEHEPSRVAGAIAAMELHAPSSRRSIATTCRISAPRSTPTIREVRQCGRRAASKCSHPGFSRQRTVASNGARRATGCPQPQHRDRSLSLPYRPAGRPLRPRPRTAGPRGPIRAGHPAKIRSDGGPGRNVTRSCRCFRICGARTAAS